MSTVYKDDVDILPGAEDADGFLKVVSKRKVHP